MLVKKAQGLDALLGGMPPAGGMPGMPQADMGAMPGAPAAPPTANQMSKGNPTEKEKPPFYRPLDSLADVLYDSEVEQKIEDSANLDADELAMQIWQDYGGDEHGNAMQGKTGHRTKEDEYNVIKADEERKLTDNSRWKRLPIGKKITDIFSLDELAKIMNSLILGHVRETKQGPAAAPGAPPMMASTNKWIRLSYIADKIHPKLGDEFDLALIKTRRLY